MEKKSKRQQYVDIIMKNKYNCDVDDMDYEDNLEFLNGLSLDDLESMAGDEFKLEDTEL